MTMGPPPPDAPAASGDDAEAAGLLGRRPTPPRSPGAVAADGGGGSGGGRGRRRTGPAGRFRTALAATAAASAAALLVFAIPGGGLGSGDGDDGGGGGGGDGSRNGASAADAAAAAAADGRGGGVNLEPARGGGWASYVAELARPAPDVLPPEAALDIAYHPALGGGSRAVCRLPAPCVGAGGGLSFPAWVAPYAGTLVAVCGMDVSTFSFRAPPPTAAAAAAMGGGGPPPADADADGGRDLLTPTVLRGHMAHLVQDVVHYPLALGGTLASGALRGGRCGRAGWRGRLRRRGCGLAGGVHAATLRPALLVPTALAGGGAKDDGGDGAAAAAAANASWGRHLLRLVGASWPAGVALLDAHSSGGVCFRSTFALGGGSSTWRRPPPARTTRFGRPRGLCGRPACRRRRRRRVWPGGGGPTPPRVRPPGIQC